MTTHRNPIARWIAPTLLGLAGATALPAAQAADVGVSIGFSQPGVYGRVDVGRYPAPALFAPQPVVVGRPAYRAQPVYLWVPPEHRHNWRRHCSYYGACGAPVYFVQDGWYQQNVIVHRERDWRREDWHDRRHDRHDHHDHDRGHGHGHGHRD